MCGRAYTSACAWSLVDNLQGLNADYQTWQQALLPLRQLSNPYSTVLLLKVLSVEKRSFSQMRTSGSYIECCFQTRIQIPGSGSFKRTRCTVTLVHKSYISRPLEDVEIFIRQHLNNTW